MNDQLIINAPQGYLTGFPIRIKVADLGQGKPAVYVKQANGVKYQISLSQNLGTFEGEILFSVPGEYEIQMGSFSQTVQVEKSQVLDFGTEFGIFSSAVVVLLIFMIVWLKRRRRSWSKPALQK